VRLEENDNTILKQSFKECDQLANAIEVSFSSNIQDFNLREIRFSLFVLKARSEMLGSAFFSQCIRDFQDLVAIENEKIKKKCREFSQLEDVKKFYFLLCQKIRKYLYWMQNKKNRFLQNDENLKKRRIFIFEKDEILSSKIEKICSYNHDLEIIGKATKFEEIDFISLEKDPHLMILDESYAQKVKEKLPVPLIVLKESLQGGFDEWHEYAIDCFIKNTLMQELDFKQYADRVYHASLCSLPALIRYYVKATIKISKNFHLDESCLERMMIFSLAPSSIRTFYDICRIFPKETPPILLVHSFGEDFTQLLIHGLKYIVSLDIFEAHNNLKIENSKIYIISSKNPMDIILKNNVFQFKSNFIKNYLDALFFSASRFFQDKAFVIYLGGLDEDGLEGMKKVKFLYGTVLVQEPMECVYTNQLLSSLTHHCLTDCLLGDEIPRFVSHYLEKKIDTFSYEEYRKYLIKISKSNLKVLIVDSSEASLISMREDLNQLGIKKYGEAKNAVEALILLVKESKTDHPYSFVFCDQKMPMMSGTDLIKNIRLNKKLKKIPFILTCATGKEMVLESIGIGVDDFLVKPIDLLTLAKKINKFLEKN
jgi:two-component system chemotaxis response regulator CheY